MVKYVKEFSCEISFLQLRDYVQGYISLFSKTYRISGCDPDEIEQQCLVALRYKVIEDFDVEKGKFMSFAILCIKRHLFSLIKGNSQQKRRVLNESLSLDESRSVNGENLNLLGMVPGKTASVFDEVSEDEAAKNRKHALQEKLSPLELMVFDLYIQRYKYHEIVNELKKRLPKRKVCKKTVDNAIQRASSKAHKLRDDLEWS